MAIWVPRLSYVLVPSPVLTPQSLTFWKQILCQDPHIAMHLNTLKSCIYVHRPFLDIFRFFSTKLGLFWTRKKHHVLSSAFKSSAASPAPLSSQKTSGLLLHRCDLQHAQSHLGLENHTAEPAAPEGAGWGSEVFAYKHHFLTVCADDACWNAPQKRSRKSPDRSNPDSTAISYNLVGAHLKLHKKRLNMLE